MRKFVCLVLDVCLFSARKSVRTHVRCQVGFLDEEAEGVWWGERKNRMVPLLGVLGVWNQPELLPKAD